MKAKNKPCWYLSSFCVGFSSSSVNGANTQNRRQLRESGYSWHLSRNKGKKMTHILPLLGEASKRALRVPCNVPERKLWPTRAETRVPQKPDCPQDPCMGQGFAKEGKVCHFVENKAQPHRPLPFLEGRVHLVLGKNTRSLSRRLAKCFGLCAKMLQGPFQEEKPHNASSMKCFGGWEEQITLDSEI